MQHQMQALFDQVNYIQHSLTELSMGIPDEIREPYDEVVREVDNWYELVTEQVSQLGFVLAPDNRQRRRRHALHEVVDNVRKSMGYYMRRNHVEFTNEVPPDLRTPSVYRAELYTILLSILTNALKAVDRQSDRQIVVTAKKIDDQLYIRMLNTGKRISPQMREKAFEPFQSDSIPNPTLGTGTGLGLTVVRDTVAFYGGEARFIDVELPWQTGIEITIPYQ
jgi:signal transduction histidine kinase